jgi:para-nitrobenzyl esterase
MNASSSRVYWPPTLCVLLAAIACGAPGGGAGEVGDRATESGGGSPDGEVNALGLNGEKGPNVAINAVLASGPLLVQTANGVLRGVVASGVDQFLGIPYAAPPEGALRFAPPAAAIPWEGERDASQPGSICPQLSLTGFVGNEDCLSLNVYRPEDHDPSELLPVMIWIHGGSFTSGAGSIYDPRRLVEINDIVIVTINYRLGPLGFLALPELSAEAGDGLSGDYGLMDQQAALGWVRDNIAAFGGDPHQVTIQGESAGGASVCAQLASPSAAGLFARAVIQSASCASVPVAQAQTQGTTIATFAASLAPDIAPCADPSKLLECVRAMPAQQLVNASATASAIYGPVVGGGFLPSAPASVVKAGTQHPVPVLIGGLRDEMLNFAAAPPFSYRSLTTADYPAVLSFWIPNIPPDEILARYPFDAYPEPYFALSAVLSDSGSFYGQALGGCVTATLADDLAASTSTYAYELDDPNFLWAPLTSFVPQGATHASDLAYLFETTPVLSQPFSAAQQALAEQMVRAWGAFIRGGDPSTPGLAWPPYDAMNRRMLYLKPGAVAVTTDFRARHNCDFWR